MFIGVLKWSYNLAGICTLIFLQGDESTVEEELASSHYLVHGEATAHSLKIKPPLHQSPEGSKCLYSGLTSIPRAL